jgi:glycosyltransferase involved in cell wall biosynthesis
VRVLIVTNLYPSAAAPQRGAFVRDQVEALRDEGIELELFAFQPGRKNYRPATMRLRKLLRQRSFDLVHAHYGLVAWCARRAGARPLVVTFHGTDVRHRLVGPLSRRLARRVELVAGVSRALFSAENGRLGLPQMPGASAVLPCGPDLDRFAPKPRREARQRLGLDPDRPYLLFPSDPERSVKRADRARALAAACECELLTGGAIPAEEMPDWVNAANAVLVTSDNEGFGLATLEALACDVPVLSTPVGIAPTVLDGLDGCLAAPFGLEAWADALRPSIEGPERRVAGRGRALPFSSRRTAARVAAAYRDVAKPVEREPAAGD